MERERLSSGGGLRDGLTGGGSGRERERKESIAELVFRVKKSNASIAKVARPLAGFEFYYLYGKS